jgi:ribosomal-protein-alanine N-acetyltransferase
MESGRSAGLTADALVRMPVSSGRVYNRHVDSLVTTSLELRPFAQDDAPVMHRIYSDPVVMRYVATGPAANLAATERLLHDYTIHQHAHGFSFWGVRERATGMLIGDAGLYRTPAGEVELGYTLGYAWWGRGYATEAARAWLEAAFGPLELEEVVALAEPANGASLRVLEKAGMRRVGERSAFGRPHVVFRIGRAMDFSYRATKHGDVLVSWRGKVVRRLVGRQADTLLERLRDAEPARVQHELARVTGNFKRGNERR